MLISRGIKLCPIILVVLPFHILVIRTCCKISRPSTIERQITEGCDPTFADRCPLMDSFKIFAQRLSGQVSNLHACRANRDRLKSSKYLNPSPPNSFGFVISLHETHAGLRLPSL